MLNCRDAALGQRAHMHAAFSMISTLACSPPFPAGCCKCCHAPPGDATQALTCPAPPAAPPFQVKAGNVPIKMATTPGMDGTRSRFRGVTWDKRENKWRCRLTSQGQHIALGRWAELWPARMHACLPSLPGLAAASLCLWQHCGTQTASCVPQRYNAVQLHAVLGHR